MEIYRSCYYGQVYFDDIDSNIAKQIKEDFEIVDSDYKYIVMSAEDADKYNVNLQDPYTFDDEKFNFQLSKYLGSAQKYIYISNPDMDMIEHDEYLDDYFEVCNDLSDVASSLCMLVADGPDIPSINIIDSISNKSVYGEGECDFNSETFCIIGFTSSEWSEYENTTDYEKRNKYIKNIVKKAFKELLK